VVPHEPDLQRAGRDDGDQAQAQQPACGRDTAEVVYGLDAGGNPLRIDEYYDAAGSYHRSAYGYDALGRLTGWTFGGDTKGWTYDWVGNWLTSSDGTFVTDPDVDWLDSSPAPSATYDYTKLGALEDMTVSANTDTFSYTAVQDSSGSSVLDGCLSLGIISAA